MQTLSEPRRSFDYLVDKAPEGVREKVIQTCSSIPGVIDCSLARVRTSGPDLFVDVVIKVDELDTTSEGHKITELVESALSGLAPRVDVVVHVEPATLDREQLGKLDIYEKIELLGRREPDIATIHNIRVFYVGTDIDIAADLEILPELKLHDAHQIADKLEQEIRNIEPSVRSVTFHLETASEKLRAKDITSESTEIIEGIKKIVVSSTSEITCSNITLREDSSGISVMIDCSVDGELSLSKSHEISDVIEKRLVESFPSIKYESIFLSNFT